MNQIDKPTARVMGLGVGSFTQGMMQVLKEEGAQVSTYLTRDYAHYSPSLAGSTYLSELYPNPCDLMQRKEIDLVIPMSIDWCLQEWTSEFLSLNIPVFSPTGEGLNLERSREFARQLCLKHDIPFPRSALAGNRLEAEEILQQNPHGYVIKNPYCSPTSPIHTIVCETVEDTRCWLDRVDCAEGIFLQEYMGRREAGHIALVSGGEIYSLVTNQEYKRAFDGNMGIVTGAPMGGIVERDPDDKYHLAKELLQPLLPWFRDVNFNGPVQVTAIRRGGKWHVLEYNVRLGVTCGPMILRMLHEPLKVLQQVAANEPLQLQFKKDLKFGCSLTLAGYGYPYIQTEGPSLPVDVAGEFDCDVWWNEVAAGADDRLYATGHRIADVIALGNTLEETLATGYRNIAQIRSLGSYFRTDVGKSLWPPGSE